MMSFFYFHDNWFDWEKNYLDLNILCLKQLINILDLFLRIILVDIGTFDGEQNNFLNIYVIFISKKSIIKKIKEWYHVSLVLY